MFLNVSKINNFIRKDDILELFTSASPVYYYSIRYYSNDYSIYMFYKSLRDILFFLSLDTSCILSPISVKYVEILLPVRKLTRKIQEDMCVCFVSNIEYMISEIELFCRNKISYYVKKKVASKYFYVIEFQSTFRIEQNDNFFDVFSFQDYLDYLISKDVININKSLQI